jgi:uncharacterized protein
MNELLSRPWPWYVAGPLIGLMVPLLLKIGNKPFGVSSSLRHVCAAVLPGRIAFFKYNWRSETWNLALVAGIAIGGVLAGLIFGNPAPVGLSSAAEHQLQGMGLANGGGLHPMELFTWHSLRTPRGFILIVVGGFLVGFGTRYANGCTSGHSIMGISNLRWPSLIATISFFAGGLLMTWVILPWILAL